MTCKPMATRPPQDHQGPTRIGMDTAQPFGVYINGGLIAHHATQRAASEHFDRLRGRSKVAPVFVGQSFCRT